ncbi:hypothetical protein CW357_06800 [Rummeliibacillus sp. TYF005]|uniref:SWIM zinc finger family protein n=1 Tax=unclassified Rummeliibacillus TaxID=2622809 RepID=UPI000E671028|nr:MULTISPECIES: SWIM zinc finger family protein [unclassified Rummeliibacillus]RIJ63511.1 hypothetical protein D1606_14515 [Rummeliibacillus sp. POC4]RPJ96055.1 hypothetical protein CW357_06800 [Rummeliibacillus sp. TYF005]
MNLTNFQNYISSTIVKRGKNYFKNGHIVELTQLTNTDWEATVEGTDDYTVHVKLSSEEEITSSRCNCPYDGTYCKHEVAVFYALQDEPKMVLNHPPLETILIEQTKDSLIHFLLDVAHEDSHFQQRILKSFMNDTISQTNLLKKAEKTILKPMKNALKKGYISSSEEDLVLIGVEEVINQVHDLIKQGELHLASELTLLCFSKTAKLYDISNHTLMIEEVLELCVSLLDEVIPKGVTSCSIEQQEDILRKLFDVAIETEEDYWKLELLKQALPFCEDPVFSNAYCTTIPKISFNSEDFGEQAEALILRALIISQDEEQIQLFIDKHRQNPHVRETLIHIAFEDEDFEKALKLASEGIDSDFGKVKLRSKWEQYAYNAHQKLGNQEAMRGIAFMLAAEGDLYFYQELKELYDHSEWSNIVQDLIVAFDELANYPSWYPDLLINEREFAKLLNYCQQSPSRIYTYSTYLKEDFSEEVKALFYQDIKKQAITVANRSGYQILRGALQQFCDAGYETDVKEITEQLKEMYPRRTALHEELRKIIWNK